jgi:hypothetical protein
MGEHEGQPFSPWSFSRGRTCSSGWPRRSR